MAHPVSHGPHRPPCRARGNTAITLRDALSGRPVQTKYDWLIALAQQVPAARTVVVHPCDETSLGGAAEAAELGIIIPILVGPAAKIAAVAAQHKLDISRCEIVDVPHSEAAAAKGVELIRQSHGELLMKGSLHTADKTLTCRRRLARPPACERRHQRSWS